MTGTEDRGVKVIVVIYTKVVIHFLFGPCATKLASVIQKSVGGAIRGYELHEKVSRTFRKYYC